MNKKNLSIDIHIPQVEIYGDRRFLQRVLYNLIDNAIKFSFSGGKIKIHTTEVDDNIKFSVIDFGIGIEEHLLEDIWDKYYKNSKSGGMGLWLPICREILKLHDFEYGVTSSKEFGTEFFFKVYKDSFRKQQL